MHPTLILLLDGLGDRGYQALGGRTTNEAARTPQLDALARRGSCGLLHPLGPGRAPSSELAHWAMLGYLDDEFPGRAVLEALGGGQKVEPDDVLAYAALRPARRRDGALWITGRVRAGEERDARELLAAVQSVEIDDLSFSLAHLGRGEGVLRISGGAHDAVTDSDPFFRDRLPVLRPTAVAPAAEATAKAAEAWAQRTVSLLGNHPLNRAREERGEDALAVVTLKWWGSLRPRPTFLERHGVHGAIVGASRFLAGLATALGLSFRACPEHPEPAIGLERRLAIAGQALADGATFVLCHTKVLDEAGHTKEPRRRLAAIEALDRPLGSLGHPPFCDAAVMVTGDHATPAEPDVIHSGDPVPLVLVGPGVSADEVERFGEVACARGLLGHLRGGDVMPVLLNAANRSLFRGSRPSPVRHACGFPAAVRPLRA